MRLPAAKLDRSIEVVVEGAPPVGVASSPLFLVGTFMCSALSVYVFSHGGRSGKAVPTMEWLLVHSCDVRMPCHHAHTPMSLNCVSRSSTRVRRRGSLAGRTDFKNKLRSTPGLDTRDRRSSGLAPPRPALQAPPPPPHLTPPPPTSTPLSNGAPRPPVAGEGHRRCPGRSDVRRGRRRGARSFCGPGALSPLARQSGAGGRRRRHAVGPFLGPVLGTGRGPRPTREFIHCC